MRGHSGRGPRELTPEIVQFVALLRALGKAVALYGISHAQVERRLCGWILDGVRAERALATEVVEGREKLEDLVSRMQRVHDSKLARADGQREKAAGQRIGELISGKSALQRPRIEMYIEVMMGFLQERDPETYRAGAYGTPALWQRAWRDANQGRMPAATLGSQAVEVLGYLDVAQRELTSYGYGMSPETPPAPTASRNLPDVTGPAITTPVLGDALDRSSWDGREVPRPSPHPPADESPGFPPSDRGLGLTAEDALHSRGAIPPGSDQPLARTAAGPPLSNGNMKAKSPIPGILPSASALKRLLIGLVCVLVLVSGCLLLIRGGVFNSGAGTPPSIQVLARPDPALPGPPGNSVALPLPAGLADYGTDHPIGIMLKVAVMSASATGDTCVLDSQFSFTIHDSSHVIAQGPLPYPPGARAVYSAEATAPPGDHDLRATILITLPAASTGCQFTIDLSGTTLTPR